MRTSCTLLSSILIVVIAFPLPSSGQEEMQHPMKMKGCQFNIAGTWQSFTEGEQNPARYRFSSDGLMQELTRHSSGKGKVWQTTGKSTYQLDNPMSPKTMSTTGIDSNGNSASSSKLQVVTFDDGLFVTVPEERLSTTRTRWTRIDRYRYFVVLAAGKGDPGFGAPGFAMLIKTDGVHTQNDAFGVYPVVHPLERHPVLGVIPWRIRKQFEREPTGDTGAMLRLEVTAGPYKRALEVLKTWERRAEENTLLYTVPYLNNAVYLNQLVSSLNQTGVLTWEGGTPCTETVKLQKLTWRLDDPIMSKHNLTQTPYYLFKTLRQMNDPLNLDDHRFRQALAGEQSSPVVISSR